MKKFNVKKNLAIVISESFKNAIRSAIECTAVERNSRNRNQEDEIFIGTIVSYNPKSNKVNNFSVFEKISDFDNKKETFSIISKKLEQILCSEDYSDNELVEIIYARDIERFEYVCILSDEDISNRSLTVQNKFMSLYIKIISRANDNYIENLDLPTRTKNALSFANIETVEQLKIITFDDIMKVKNLGQKSVDELEEKLNIRFNRLQVIQTNKREEIASIDVRNIN